MLDMNRLIVLETRASLPERSGWKWKTFEENGFLAIETCSRHTYVCLAEQFPEDYPGFPGNKKRENKGPGQPGSCKPSLQFHKLLDHVFRDESTFLHRGPAAHKFLVEFFCGLKSRKHSFEDNIMSQMKVALRRYKSGGYLQKDLAAYMQTVFRDGRRIREALPSFLLKRPEKIKVAIELARMSPKHTALVFGGDSQLTRDLIGALGHKKRNTPGNIILTPVNWSDFPSLQNGLNNLDMKAALSIVPEEKSLYQYETLFKANAVFVCSPVNERPQFDEMLCKLWERRCQERPGPGRIIHLVGDPGFNGAMTGPWKNLDYDGQGLIDPSMIEQERVERFRVIRGMIPVVSEAIDELTECTLKDKAIRKLAFNIEEKTYFLESVSRPIPPGKHSPQREAWAIPGVRRPQPLAAAI
ncbi:MAG: hypothetical protein PHY92_08970 [Alphaproteobacteria bacterium]|nr:hypothetical protein [Alphaproteobacteria bacterium]